MANLGASKKLLKMLINQLENEISNQCIAKKADKIAIEKILEDIDKEIMFEIGNMVNATEQADKNKIQAWIEKTNKKTKRMLNKYKGRNSDVDEVLKSSEDSFDKNDTNTVLGEMKEAAKKDGKYKREDFATRYQKNEDVIKKSAKMMVKTKKLEEIRGKDSKKEIRNKFAKVIGEYAEANELYGRWQKDINSIDEIKDYDFSEKTSNLLRRISAIKSSDPIPERLKKDFNELKLNLGKINFDLSYNKGVIDVTKQAIKDILAVDLDDKTKTITSDDIKAKIQGLETNMLNLKTNALEIANPKEAKNSVNQEFFKHMEQCRYFEIFPDETKEIKDMINSDKSMSEKTTYLSKMFKQLEKELNEVLETSYVNESEKNSNARVKRAEVLKPEKVQVEGYETAKEEVERYFEGYGDNKDKTMVDVAKEKLDELSDEVTDLETEVNDLEVDKNNLEAEGNRLEAEVNTLESEKNTLKNRMVDLAMELAEDDEKQRQAAQAGPTVDPTKLNLGDLGFSSEFQLQEGGFIGGTPTYCNFVTAGVTTRTPGARQDSDSLVDEIYNQLKKESGFANVAEKLRIDFGHNEITEVKHPRLSKLWAKIRSKIPKLNSTDSKRDKTIKKALTDEIKKRIGDLRDLHEAAQSAPVAGALSDEDRFAKEKAYEVAATEYESKQAEYEAKQEERSNKVSEYETKNDAFIDKLNEYEAKRSEKAAQEDIYQDINDKYTARKKAFEDSLKVKEASDNKYQANVNKAIYETVKKGEKVDAESIKEEAEKAEERD